MNTNPTFSQRLKSLREQSGLSQVDFAAKLLISRGLYNGLETGRVKPSKWIVQQVNMLEQVGVEILNRTTTYPQAEPEDLIIREDQQPTRELCEAFFKRYLDEAEKIPGGIGHTWVQLRLNFSPEALIRIKQ